MIHRCYRPASPPLHRGSTVPAAVRRAATRGLRARPRMPHASWRMWGSEPGAAGHTIGWCAFAQAVDRRTLRQRGGQLQVLVLYSGRSRQLLGKRQQCMAGAMHHLEDEAVASRVEQRCVAGCGAGARDRKAKRAGADAEVVDRWAARQRILCRRSRRFQAPQPALGQGLESGRLPAGCVLACKGGRQLGTPRVMLSVLNRERGTSQRPGAPIFMRSVLRDTLSTSRVRSVMSAPSSSWVPRCSVSWPRCELPAAPA